MQDQNRITDYEPILAAARQDASREGAKMVFMTVGELWRLIHRAPRLSGVERDDLAQSIKPG